MLFVRVNGCLGEQLDWRLLRFVLHIWGRVDAVVCVAHGVGPQVGCDCLWPSLVRVQKHRARHPLQFPYSALRLSIGMVGANSCEREVLSLVVTCLHPPMRLEDSVIGVVGTHCHPSVDGIALKSSLALQCFFNGLSLL